MYQISNHQVKRDFPFNSLLWLVVFSRSVMSDSLQPHGHQASLSFTISWNLLKLTSTESMIPSNHLVLCHPLLLLPSIFPSIRIFSNESALHIRWPKYWSFSFSSSNEYSRLISFKIDQFDLLAVQGTLKSLFQHHSSKASVLQCSAFFMVQLSHPYMTTGKTIALTIQTFISKVMSLLFNTLSRFIIVFLPRSKCLLISWLQSLSTVILEPQKIKSVIVSTVSPSICHEEMRRSYSPGTSVLKGNVVSQSTAILGVIFLSMTKKSRQILFSAMNLSRR